MLFDKRTLWIFSSFIFVVLSVCVTISKSTAFHHLGAIFPLFHLSINAFWIHSK